MRELHQKYNIGYNAVANITALLEIDEGKIILKDDIPNLADIDPRWNEKLLNEYVKMLNCFYKESNFNSFFNDHKWLYDIAEQRMIEYFHNVDIYEWIKSFFGEDLNQNLNICISLVNGRHNYAYPGGVIIGVYGDANGMPTPNLQTLPILVHEILHHYTNPIFFTFWNKMKNAADKIYPFVCNQMSMIAYDNSQTMTLEWLNNLFVLMYLKQKNHELLEFFLTQNMEKGFIWMKRSMEFVDNFSLNKELYPSIEYFMAQLVSFFNYTADNFELVMTEYESLHPLITNIFPAPGSSLKGFDRIVITFSQPMNGSYGFCGVPFGCEPLPVDFNNIKWSDDKCHFIMKLDSNIENYDCKFGIKLNNYAFQSSKYYPLNKNVKCDIVY